MVKLCTHLSLLDIYNDISKFLFVDSVDSLWNYFSYVNNEVYSDVGKDFEDFFPAENKSREFFRRKLGIIRVLALRFAVRAQETVDKNIHSPMCAYGVSYYDLPLRTWQDLADAALIISRIYRARSLYLWSQLAPICIIHYFNTLRFSTFLLFRYI